MVFMEVWFATRTQHVIQGRKASTDMLFRWICVFRHCLIWYTNSNECNCESIWHTWRHHQVRLVISWWDVYHIGLLLGILQRVTLAMGPDRPAVPWRIVRNWRWLIWVWPAASSEAPWHTCCVGRLVQTQLELPACSLLTHFNNFQQLFESTWVYKLN